MPLMSFHSGRTNQCLDVIHREPEAQRTYIVSEVMEVKTEREE